MADLRHPGRLLLAALGLGVCAEWLWFDRLLGISVPIFVGLLLVALLLLGSAEGLWPRRGSGWLAGGALLFAGLVAWRDAGPLVALDLMAVALLLLLLAATFRGPALWRVGGARLLGGALLALGEASFRPPVLAVTMAAAAGKGWRPGPVLFALIRGLLLAIPVLSCFGLLLVSADGVFANLVQQIFTLQLPFALAPLVARGMLATIVAWGCAGGLLVALIGGMGSTTDPTPAVGDTQRLRGPGLGALESLTVLALVDALFAVFMLVQGAYLFGGLDTLDRTGMTYAAYARRGFFELVTVACLALGLLWALSVATGRSAPWQRRWFNSLCGIMIGLVLGMLVSAFQRMWLYEMAYGFTRLRIYTQGFMGWLAAALLLMFLSLVRGRPRLFSHGAAVAALVFLLALNVANPDALIVRENVQRHMSGGPLDAYYLASLSADAAPALVEALPSLSPEDRAVIADRLAQQQQQIANAGGWPAWNASRAVAGETKIMYTSP